MVTGSWTNEEIDLLKNQYGTLTARQISVLLNCSKKRVKDKAKYLKLTSPIKGLKTYSVNKDYFSIINDQNSYWVGLIAADGCIMKIPETTGNYRLSLYISEIDKQHVENFKKIINFTGKIKIQNARLSIFPNGKMYETKKSVGVRISCDDNQFYKDLNHNFNITPNKSLTLQSPNLIAENHIRPFIRGLMDGDGWISYDQKKKHWILGFCGTKNILDWIKFNIQKYVPEALNPSVLPLKNIYHIQFSGKQTFPILNWLYDGSAIETRLDRKYAKYLEVCQFYG